MLKKIYITALFLILPLFTVLSQYYSSGADPASIKWKSINNERFRMVFPEEFSRAATDLAFFLDSIAPKIEATLDHTPRKIDILIHSHSTYTNGFVSWAPRRIELYPNPDQDIYSTDWLKQLALHEYRHIVQIDKLRQGFTRYVSWLTGEQATGAALGAYLPMWFIEGDAVVTETTLSKSGRGRTPVFSQSLRARISKYGPDKYDKAYLGSYKEYIPNYYQMGYHLTAEIRKRYGTEIWEEVIRNVGRNSWSLIPFRQKLQKTGYNSPSKLYKAIYDSLAVEWKKHEESIHLTHNIPIAKQENSYSNIEYPVITDQGDIFAEINGPGLRTRIVQIKSGEINGTIDFTGYRENGPVAANERWVAWAETKPHIRWPNADYSIIRVYNRKDGKTFTLKNDSRFFAPSLAPASDTLVVVESNEAYSFFITLIEIQSGKIIKQIPIPGNKYPIHPRWTDSQGRIVMVLLSDAGKEIVELDTEQEEWKQLRKPAFDEPKYPTVTDNKLLFTASTLHSEEIFKKDLETGQTSQITKSRFGATTPLLDPENEKIFYLNYTAKGYKLVSTEMDQTFKEDVEPANLTNPLVEKLTEQEPSIPNSHKQKLFSIEPYSKWNLFNLHSWAPAYIDIDETLIAPGVTLMSQNLLGTAITRMGYNANKSESREKFDAGFTYRGWFPVIDFDVKWGDFSETFDGYYTDNNQIFSIRQLGKEKQLKLESGIRVPLDISIGKWNRIIQPRIKLSWQKNSNRIYEQTNWDQYPDGSLVKTGESEFIEIPDLDYWGMEYSLYFHNKLRGTSRDVNTRWGQTISLIYRHTPWGNYNSGDAYAASSRIYLPGIGKHQALVLENAWQNKTNGDQVDSELPYKVFQRFGDLISLPRGYSFIKNDDMYLFRSSYQMPLWNPDLSFGGVAYIKRFRLNAFFDAAIANYELDYIEENNTENFSNWFTSTGIELMADFHPFRFVLPFSIGYRGGFRDADNTFFHEAIFSTSFNSFLINKRK
ncbi:TolB-like translocation protein [Marinilabilia rubra]|uniref:Uncharacterized protein n=1 Tax=Marinilabilia rubra TaxID=2162893 RepID=A0A2U2B3Z4_9BACT|nr:hypothetical protein [Marinilabilia rubra]PWD97780.1 hypothetical protein DDZ16_18850 [Marinilabilia rubra]